MNMPSSDNTQSPPAICTTNIGPRERRKRMTFGIVSLVVGAGFGAALLALGLGRAWRLALFLPFVGGGVGIFQALDKT